MAMAGSSRHIYGAWQNGGVLFIGTSGLAEGGYLGAEWRETRADWVFRAPGSGSGGQQRWPYGYGIRTGQLGQSVQMWCGMRSTGIQHISRAAS